ncbi:MAG: DUF4349 domain-containing protein [Spirochaetales bacterium]|nr:DUF4349 domain-containing protein [Spirochaetales bacterium]
MLNVIKTLFFLVFIFLISCAPSYRDPAAFKIESDNSETYYDESEENAKELELNKAGKDLSSLEERTKEWEGTGFNAEGPPGLENQNPAAFAANLVAAKQDASNKIYSGYGELKVDVVEEVKKQITKIAETSGGYVEDVYEDSITIRVPVERFGELFGQILALGELVHKSIETIDVTEYYTDLKSRLQISIKTRNRLYALLGRTRDVKEQLEILKEIKRLTEEIERITLELKLVENQIRYSRITIRLIPRITQAALDQKKIPFSWIANLNPLFPSLTSLDGAVELELDDEYAVFEQDVIYRAESADGVRVRIGTTINSPKGDSAFWQRALNFHLKRFYREIVGFSEGPVMGVLLKSKDSKPFYYLVGTLVKGDKIFVIEVFFSDEVVYNQKYESIRRAVEDMEIK